MDARLRLSLYANQATLIEYDQVGGLLWWDGVPIGQLVDSPRAAEPVKVAVERLHRADVEAISIRRARLETAARLEAG